MHYRIGYKRGPSLTLGYKKPHIALGIGKKFNLSNFDVGLRKVANTIQQLGPAAMMGTAAYAPELVPLVGAAMSGAVANNSFRKSALDPIRKTLGS